jgi:uncharacterized protein YciI
MRFDYRMLQATIYENLKLLVCLIGIVCCINMYGQSDLPTFMAGTWKMENKEIYEHWDILNDQSMKGFSYSSLNNKMKISEYIDITKTNKGITYSASVINQNKGKGIVFKMQKSDSSFIFENPKHDFPKKIIYKKIDNDHIQVVLTDGKEKNISYLMVRQNKTSDQTNPSNADNPLYDAELAQKLGADDFGMKRFTFVVLKTGPNTTTDKTFINNAFRGHMENINQLVADGKLIVAGPFGKNDDSFRGLFILNTADVEEAKALLQTDAAIKEQLLEAHLYPWYGSAALSEYLKFSDMVWKVKP